MIHFLKILGQFIKKLGRRQNFNNFLFNLEEITNEKLSFYISMKLFIQKTSSQKLINNFLFCENYHMVINYLMVYNFRYHKYILI